ncbi:glycosyltransferase family 1 protein [Gammaproteobacteria bacterium LSUCC0112]|nr:glycosyltransferase family 1 protein [Gammaproteobacteria bacterium LSUCC0112]
MIALNTAWNLVNFRSGLIRALVAEGYDVVAVAPYDEYASQLLSLGCRYHHLPMDNKGTHPGRDLLLLARFYRLIRLEVPDVFLGFTIKPNIYGSLAAHTLGVSVINNIAGLGTVFTKDGLLNHLVRALYKVSLSHSYKVFFQNDEDRQLFVSSGLVSKNVVDRLPGSGVDLDKFTPVPLPGKPSVRFLLIARMLWEKGVGDFVAAARLMKLRGIEAEFCLLGFLEVQNPSAISQHQMDLWVDEGVVKYLGVSDNIRNEIAQADCVVLPSFYREGTPRALLEAAAMARPIVTTDSIGCRDVVDDGINGFLCCPKDPADLAHKMARIIALPPKEREMMGLRGRKKVELQFDQKVVIDKYLEAIRKIRICN